MPSEQTEHLEECLRRLRAGDTGMSDEIIRHTSERLAKTAHSMRMSNPTVQRYSETGDIFSDAMLQLHRALTTMEPDKLPDNPVDYYRFASHKMRQVMINLWRKYNGRQGVFRNHDTQSSSDVAPEKTLASREPQTPDEWIDLHEAVETLPSDQQEFVDLYWYQGFKHQEIADLLGISLSGVKRRWRNAKISLGTKLQGTWE